MPLTNIQIPCRSLLPLLSAARRSLSGPGSSAAESRPEKLNRIADELLDLNKIERQDYSILFRLKLGLDRWGPVTDIAPAAGGAASPDAAATAAATEVKEKTAFDVKLEKFDAAAKIKVIKEVRAFTDLGLKEAKEIVEKAPVVVKKGVTKEEAEAIAAKLKEVGATVLLE
ncbi:putative ribosomal protein L7/L12 [Dioscorea sansibarensis]